VITLDSFLPLLPLSSLSSPESDTTLFYDHDERITFDSITPLELNF